MTQMVMEYTETIMRSVFSANSRIFLKPSHKIHRPWSYKCNKYYPSMINIILKTYNISIYTLTMPTAL
jgi:hypothetical protein